MKNSKKPQAEDYDGVAVKPAPYKLPPPPPPAIGREESMAEIFEVKQELPHTRKAEQVSRPVRLVDAWGRKKTNR